MTSTFGCRRSPSAPRIASVSSSSPRLASINSATMSASCTPAQAFVTMARSSRRLGENIPGVSTKMSCALPSVAIPRSNARVVCTLWDTIATLVPTSALINVDLPTFGAPISATKPQRVPEAAPDCSLAIDVVRLDALALEHGGGGSLLGRALRAAEAFGGREFREFDRDTEFGIVVGALALDLAVSRRRQPPRLRPLLQHRLGIAQRPHRHPHALLPERRDHGGGRLIAAIDEHGANQGFAHIGENCGAVAPTRVVLRCPKADDRTDLDHARHVRARFLAHEIGKPPRHLAFVRLREGSEQHVRNDQTEHVVA